MEDLPDPSDNKEKDRRVLKLLIFLLLLTASVTGFLAFKYFTLSARNCSLFSVTQNKKIQCGLTHVSKDKRTKTYLSKIISIYDKDGKVYVRVNFGSIKPDIYVGDLELDKLFVIEKDINKFGNPESGIQANAPLSESSVKYLSSKYSGKYADFILYTPDSAQSSLEELRSRLQTQDQEEKRNVERAIKYIENCIDHVGRMLELFDENNTTTIYKYLLLTNKREKEQCTPFTRSFRVYR